MTKENPEFEELEKRRVKASPPSILTEAQQITDTGHDDQYGSWDEEIGRVVTIMQTLYPPESPQLLNSPAEARATMFMVVLKMVRESRKHKRDNLVDMAGYIRLLSQLYGEEGTSNERK